MTQKAIDMIKGGKRPKGLGYDDYSSMMKGAGEEPLSKAEYEEMEEDEAVEKAGVNSDDLIKAMEDYEVVEEATAENLGSEGRETYLQARLTAGTISKSERVELGQLLTGSDDAPAEPLNKSLIEHVRDVDDDEAELFDAAPVLKSLATALDNSLQSLGSRVGRESMATRNLLKAQGTLVKALGAQLVQQGEVLQQTQEVNNMLKARLERVESTPGTPRAVRRTQPPAGRSFAKSTVGSDGGGEDTLTKSQAHDALDRMLVKAVDAGDESFVTTITHAAAKLESTGQLDPQIRARVEQHVAGQ